jgi:hypothetical protein
MSKGLILWENYQWQLSWKEGSGRCQEIRDLEEMWDIPGDTERLTSFENWSCEELNNSRGMLGSIFLPFIKVSWGQSYYGQACSFPHRGRLLRRATLSAPRQCQYYTSNFDLYTATFWLPKHLKFDLKPFYLENWQITLKVTSGRHLFVY